MINVQENLKAITAAHADYAKTSFEQVQEHVQKLTTAKSLEEAVSLQTEYTQAALATFTAEATKISDLYKSFAKEAFAPFAAILPKATA